MDQQLVAQDPIDPSGPEQRVYPLLLCGGSFGFETRERLPGLAERTVELGHLSVLVGGRGRDIRWRVTVLERLAPLGDVIEERKDLVELLLADRIELVVVAPRAPERQAQPHGRGRRYPIDHVLHQELFGDDAPLAVLAVVPVEGGGDSLAQRGFGEQVAGKLFDGELIKRHVGVVGIDHPVAVPPHGSFGIGLIPAGVSIPGAVQPLDGHPLPVSR